MIRGNFLSIIVMAMTQRQGNTMIERGVMIRCRVDLPAWIRKDSRRGIWISTATWETPQPTKLMILGSSPTPKALVRTEILPEARAELVKRVVKSSPTTRCTRTLCSGFQIRSLRTLSSRDRRRRRRNLNLAQHGLAPSRRAAEWYGGTRATRRSSSGHILRHIYLEYIGYPDGVNRDGMTRNRFPIQP